MIKGEKAQLIQCHFRVNSYNGPLLSIINDDRINTQTKRTFSSNKIIH
jgi:hypothetical protein